MKNVLFVRAIELMINVASLTFPKQRSAISKCPAITLIYIRKIMLSTKIFQNSIKTLFSDQLSSLEINPQIKTLTLLDFSHKQEPMLTMQSAISKGESVNRLLVPHNVTTFLSDKGINRFLVCQSTFSTQSLPIPKFNAFNGVKYLCHTFKYLEKLAIMESRSNKVFVN